MSFSSEILADSPLWWVRLGEASGTTLNDSSGNSRNGTYSGGPTFGAGALLASERGVDTATTFDGSNDRGDVTHATWMDNTVLTLEAWVKTSSLANMGVLMRDDGTVTGRPWYFFLRAGVPTFLVFTSADVGDPAGAVAGTRSIADGCAHHIAASYSNSDHVGRIYIDGALDSTVTTGTNAGLQTGIRVATSNLLVGYDIAAGPTNRFFFDGTLDELVWFNTRLSDARIAAHYAAGPRIPCGDWHVGAVKQGAGWA